LTPFELNFYALSDSTNEDGMSYIFGSTNSAEESHSLLGDDPYPEDMPGMTIEEYFHCRDNFNSEQSST
jgi:hypothetical protein